MPMKNRIKSAVRSLPAVVGAICGLLFSSCGFSEGVRQSNNDDPSTRPATDAPIAVVGKDFVNSAVEILSDYKDYKNGNTGWLYTLEKGLHAYSTVTSSVSDAKAALKPFVDSKGQPFLDRLMLLLQKKPDVPLATKMAALAHLAGNVAADPGP
jgi:hypothetical protein